MTECLIVDDSSTIRKIVRGMCEGFGFECYEAENGLEAYEFCAHRRKPDLIMLDWNMPVMTGIEFMNKLSTSNFSFLPKVIFCTTESQISYIELALSAGAIDYIIKPFEKEMLKTKLITLGFLDADEL